MALIVELSRSPHGERGLKSPINTAVTICLGRSPHGERGLKYDKVNIKPTKAMSLSSRRAWIEILYLLKLNAVAQLVALLTESVD